MPKIYLYAEVLTHLRQLTLHASLETEKNEDTKIEISSDKKIITVLHDGESASLYLPTQISGSAQVTFPYDKKTELSARVQIEDLEQWQETDAEGIEAPWNASELSFETSFTCRECDSEILPMGTISSWKDLPNQNWADVMDLWFCHKPHDHSDGKQEQQAAEAKGFSAQSRLASQPGKGMVNLVSFVLHPDDCSNLEIGRMNNENSFKPARVLCGQCQAHMGSFSSSENLVRLYKASLKVRSSRKEDYVCFPISTFVSAELLELIDSTAIRKVVVYSIPADTDDGTVATSNKTEEGEGSPTSCTKGTHDSPSSQGPETAEVEAQPTEENISPDPPSTQPLLLWIFNPDIYYSSSRLTTETKIDHASDTLQTLSVSSTNSETTPSSSEPSQTTSTTTTSDPPTSPQSTPAQRLKTSITHPHRALKIFYRPLTPSETTTLLPSPPPKSSNPLSSTTEPLPLPPQTLHALHTTLSASTTHLPASARTFQDFSVGLLDRYERHPTAERVMENNPLARKLQGEDREELGVDGRPRVTRWELPAGAHELYL